MEQSLRRRTTPSQMQVFNENTRKQIIYLAVFNKKAVSCGKFVQFQNLYFLECIYCNQTYFWQDKQHGVCFRVYLLSTLFDDDDKKVPRCLFSRILYILMQDKQHCVCFRVYLLITLFDDDHNKKYHDVCFRVYLFHYIWPDDNNSKTQHYACFRVYLFITWPKEAVRCVPFSEYRIM